MDNILVGDKYEIDIVCYETYPCQHNVRNLQNGTSIMMSGEEIYNLLQEHGISNAHFNMYAPIDLEQRIANLSPEMNTAFEPMATILAREDVKEQYKDDDKPISEDGDYRIGDQYEIESICYQSYPCQHYVRNLQDGTRTMMHSDDIYNLLQEHGIMNAHFAEYSNDRMVEQQRKWEKQIAKLRKQQK